MPFIHIRITDEGVTPAQRAELVRRSTDMMVQVLGKNPATTMVVIDEIPTDRWGVAGELVSTRRARGQG